MRLLKKIMALAATVMAFSAMSAFNVYDFDDTEKKKQFATLIDELRCPKCQNNNLADSNAPLATDIKNYVYQSVKSGQSSDEITSFLVSRYGEFVTYRPRNRWIWLAPTFVGFLALVVAVIRIRRKSNVVTETAEQTPSMQSIISEHQQQQERN